MDDKQEKAIRFYEKHLERLRKYNDTHREQIRLSAKNSYIKMRDDPERYEVFKAKKRQYYHSKKEQKVLEKVIEKEK